jgi:hypothetical protein
VIDGPFAETKELVAGYWLWECKSLKEAIEWVKKCPNPMPGEDSDIEIRQIFEAEDFGAAYTPEERAREESCASTSRGRSRWPGTSSPRRSPRRVPLESGPDEARTPRCPPSSPSPASPRPTPPASRR